MTREVIRAVWHTISELPTALSLLLVLGLIALTLSRIRGKSSASIARWGALILVVFAFVDWGLLTALPLLDLSFGPVGLPLLGITIVRCSFIWMSHRLWLIMGSLKETNVSETSHGSFVVSMLILQLLITGCEVNGLYFEPFNVGITSVEIPAETQSNGQELKIVQLSDLHMEYITKRERQVVEQVMGLKPDLIVLTADFLNTSYTYDDETHTDLRWVLSQLEAPYGIYAIRARNVDPPEVVEPMFKELGIRFLDDEVEQIEIGKQTLHIVGVTFLDRGRDAQILHELASQLPANDSSLLLYHTPDLIETAAEVGIDLYLAGHTHGGQVRLPWFGAIVTASSYWKRFEQGYYEVGETVMYVSRGIGLEGHGAPRVRFLCPPEVVEVRWRL
ncbi:MAG: metallophosphoesterase [Chloroflexota bacterium]